MRLTLAFRLAAERTPSSGGPSASASVLAADRRTRLPTRLDALVAARRSPSAWEGMTVAAGVEMAAPAMAVVALEELVGESPEERAGLYGPRVPVPDDAPAFDRLLELTGRDPGWRP